MSDDIAIAWTDLSVSSKPSLFRSAKVILRKVCGQFKFNSINALMGSSGSGKTTLLKCLNASNKYCFSDDSNVWIPKDFEIRKCFVYQNHEKRVMTGLTIRQAFTYASKLKNSAESNVNHKKIISEVMSELLITEVADNLIEKCSGGEVKRICIGLELTALNKPNLLFIDEPTTGLDSTAAQIVISCLRQLSQSHRMSVITSIHQPNQELFLMFDSVYVLAKGGVCVYSGPPQSLTQHLIESQIDCKENQIPVEVLIKLCSKGIADKDIKQLLVTTYKKESHSRVQTENLRKLKEGLKSRSKSFKLIDFWYLLMRFLYYNYVSQRKSLLKVISMMFVVIAFSLNCSNEGLNQKDGCFEPNSTASNCFEIEEENSTLAQNQMLIHFTFLFMSLIIYLTQTSSWANSMKLFRAERQNLWYSSGSYWWAKLVVDFILMTIYSIMLLFGFQYFRPQVDDYYKLGYIFFMIIMAFNISNCLSSIMAIIFSSNESVALLLSVAIFTSLTNFNNFFIRVSYLPEIIQKLQQYNYTYYYFNSFVILVYGLGRCSQRQLSKVLIDFGLEDDEYLFHKYFYSFIACYVFLVIIQFLIFLMKANYSSINWFCIQNKFHDGNNETHIQAQLYNELGKEVIEQNNRYSMISWVDLTYNIRKGNIFGKTQVIPILNKINGNFEAYTLNAIMGPSGAGKTTLINCLNGKGLNHLSKESKIYVSNQRFRTCFIVQNVLEHILKGMTVRETLLYASKLKNSQILENLDHNRIVSDLMSELLISETVDNRVESCSGGEQKRIVIASELTAQNKPNILFIDEPTSGLDSYAAELLINCLKRLSRPYRMSIVISIHQPNQDLFLMFDSVYVLAKGGVCVYSGRPQNLSQHLIDSDINCNENQVPIEELLRISSKETTKYSNILIEKSNEKNKFIEQNCLTENMLLFKGRMNFAKRFTLRDFHLVLSRTMTYSYKRQWIALVVLFVSILIIAQTNKTNFSPDIIVPDGCISANSSSVCFETAEDVLNYKLIKLNISYNLTMMTSVAFVVMIMTTVSFSSEYKTFRSEQNNGWYSTGTFILAKNLVDLIPQLFIIGVFCWIVVLYSEPKFYLLYYVLNIVMVICVQSLAQVGAIIFPYNTKLSLISVHLIFFLMMILGNNFFPLKELHYSLQTLSSLSYIKYSYEILLLNIYDCPQNQWSTVLFKNSITKEDLWPNIWKLVIVTIFYKVLNALILIVKTNFSFTDSPITERHELDHVEDGKYIRDII